MKLVDVLANELERKGGWPSSAIECTQDEDGCLCFWQAPGSYCWQGYWKHPSGDSLAQHMICEEDFTHASDRGKAVVTWQQYEEARHNQCSFETLSKKIMQWLNKNAAPHSIIVIDANSATLYSGEKTVFTEEFIEE